MMPAFCRISWYLVSTQREGWPKTVLSRGEGDVIAAEGFGVSLVEQMLFEDFAADDRDFIEVDGIFIGFKVRGIGP